MRPAAAIQHRTRRVAYTGTLLPVVTGPRAARSPTWPPGWSRQRGGRAGGCDTVRPPSPMRRADVLAGRRRTTTPTPWRPRSVLGWYSTCQPLEVPGGQVTVLVHAERQVQARHATQNRGRRTGVASTPFSTHPLIHLVFGTIPSCPSLESLHNGGQMEERMATLNIKNLPTPCTGSSRRGRGVSAGRWLRRSFIC